MNHKTHKAIRSLILLLLMSMTIIATPHARSAETAVLYVNPKHSYSIEGQSHLININIANVTNLNLWQIKLTFDPTILNCTQVTVPEDNIFKGHDIFWPPPDINNTAGFLRAFCAISGTEGVTGSGTLCQIEFKCLTTGTSSLNFVDKTTQTYLWDPNGIDIPFESINGIVDVGNPEEHLSVPFHDQTKTYYSGPASLEMVFDFYGEDIPQPEIADAARTFPNVTYTDELRRAGHFSNTSTSTGQEMPQNITGYSLRKLGYGAFEKCPMSLQELKYSVDSGYPIIVLTWYDPSKNRDHYRVVTGYNESYILLHDPWNKTAWGGIYGGPDTSLDYITFLNLWSYSNYWGLCIHPWNVIIKPEVIQPSVLNITASISYICPEIFQNGSYPASSCNATITFTQGLSLGSGETPKKTLGTGNISPGTSGVVSWIIKVDVLGTHNITVIGEGYIFGNVGSHGSYPNYNYKDRIGGEKTIPVTIRNPIPWDIYNDNKTDMRDIAIVARAFGSYPGHPRWNPIADINGAEYLVPDGKVDMKDVSLVAKHFGERY